MTANLDTLSAKLDLVLAEVRAIKAEKKPGLTQAAFAKLIGKHPRTIARMIGDKRLRLKNHLVPQEEVQRFVG